MKHIAILLQSEIKTNVRAIKTITTLSQIAFVDLFYINGNEVDKQIFNKNVKLYSIKKPSGFIAKIRQNLFFTDEFLFFVKAVQENSKKYDFIWANDLPTLKPASIIKKKTGAKLIYDSYEIYYETVNQFFDARKSKIKSVIFPIIIFLMRIIGKTTEKHLIKKVDYFITTCTSFKNYFQNTRNYKMDIKIVMNCPFTKPCDEVYDLRKKYNISPQTKIALFQGVLNKGRALKELVGSMKFVKSDVKLIILGYGTLKNDLIQQAELQNIKDRIIFDVTSLPELPKYTKGADFGINLQAPVNLSKKLASANKLFEYIHANIPIIASDVPENRLTIEKYKVGILVNNTPQEIARAIDFMTNANYTEYKENCKSAALEYCWEKQEKEILNIFDK